MINEKIEELNAILPQLSDEAVEELLARARRWQLRSGQEQKVVPVKLGGLWEGVTVSDEDIREMRREALSSVGDDSSPE